MTSKTISQTTELFCKHCETTKPQDEFYKAQKSECKVCTRLRVAKNGNKYDLTEKGVIRVIYKTQKRNNRLRGHGDMPYSKNWLNIWLYENGFKVLFDEWVKSDYKKDLKPSVDRDDSLIGYSKNSIKLVTWGENRESQYKDIKTASGSSGRRCMKVSQFLKDGKTLVKTYDSQNIAKRSTGICNRQISACVKGRHETAGGFVWKQYSPPLIN